MASLIKKSAYKSGYNPPMPVYMAEETVQSIIAINRLSIPDVLIDIIKDFLYIDAYTVWRNMANLRINKSIIDLDYSWVDMYDQFGRKRMTHWTKGNMCAEPQLQCYTCVTCGESSFYHTNLDGCCRMENDFHEDGEILLVEDDDTDQTAAYTYPEEDENDDASYQDDEYDW